MNHIKLPVGSMNFQRVERLRAALQQYIENPSSAMKLSATHPSELLAEFFEDYGRKMSTLVKEALEKEDEERHYYDHVDCGRE